jgi:CheY-like chemotaxis protein
MRRVESHVQITISDTGIGIPAEFLPHVFDRFRQADASITRRHGGLGLGLSIVRQLVELHGGTASVSSAGAGQGATFTITLPIAPIQAPHAGLTPTKGELKEAGASPGCERLPGVRILVVDDEVDNRNLVKRVLNDCDADVESAGSAAEALKLLSAKPYDVLVSDIGMPDEDGYSLMRKVRQSTDAAIRTIPAIALTAFARSEDRISAIRAGFQSHVVKPVEPAELIAIVASLAGLNSKARETDAG